MSGSRLPTTTQPRHYTLTLQPDLKKFVFSGTVVIDLVVVEQTDEIVLNALELEISSGVVVQDGAELRADKIVVVEKPKERATFSFSRPLKPGKAQLTVVFTGTLNDKLAGFYRSKYIANGEERYMATTQFEATDARRAFPCWDEPALKATFDVILIVPDNRLAISNMPVRDVVPRPETHQREVHFDRTPIMSTYLLAMVVSEFDHIESTTAEGILVRVYTPLGKKYLGEFALNVATRALSFFTRLFRIAYPLPKMDLLAIPDFAAGAMENWGCITYREVALLIDAVDSSAERRQRVARTVCHEIAHQWFGNLVTMTFWDQLWLNEGFARFLEFCAVANLFPEWDIWAQFVLSIHGTAMRHDALSTSHPIEVPVENPDEINEIFDIISYAKGASIIRMLCDYIGEETFFAGLFIYLTRHAYKNANTVDLWAAMQEASGKKVRELMSQWTLQTGYPVLKITADGISQQRYLSTGNSGPGEWRIPIKLLAVIESNSGSVSSEVRDLGLLETAEDAKRIFAAITQAEENAVCIKLNPGQIGFYRVLYSPTQWSKLEANVTHLPAADRLGALTDAFALVRSGHLSVDRMLSLVTRYKNEQDFSVWSEIVSNLETFCRLFCDSELFPLLARFVVVMCAEVRDKLVDLIATLERPDGNVMQFYAVIHAILVLVNEPRTIGESKQLFQSHYRKLMGTLGSENDSLILPDLRQSVYAAVIQAGGEREYNQVLGIYEKSELSEERRRCLFALGASRDPELLQRTLNFALSNEVRPQDSMFPMAAVASNLNKGRQIAWKFFEEQFAELDKRFNAGGQSFLLSAIVGGVATGLTTAEANTIEAFFKKHSWPAADNAIRSSIENIRIAATRIQRDTVPMHTWLQQYFALPH